MISAYAGEKYRDWSFGSLLKTRVWRSLMNLIMYYVDVDAETGRITNFGYDEYPLGSS